MAFLSDFGKIIIAVSVIGCVCGLYEGAVLSNGFIGVISVLGLVGGCYVGYLGVKIDAMDERESARDSGYSARMLTKTVELLSRDLDTMDTNVVADIDALEARVKKLEGEKSRQD